MLNIEFQKWILPYLCCLLWLDEADKPKLQDFNIFVNAEIPDLNEHPDLHKLVLKQMIYWYCSKNSIYQKNCICSNKRQSQNHSLSIQGVVMIHILFIGGLQKWEDLNNMKQDDRVEL